MYSLIQIKYTHNILTIITLYRVTTQVCNKKSFKFFTTKLTGKAEYKEAFALFDKRGTGAVPREVLGDLLRALGQNPTQAEVADIVASAPRDGTHISYPTHNPFFVGLHLI